MCRVPLCLFTKPTWESLRGTPVWQHLSVFSERVLRPQAACDSCLCYAGPKGTFHLLVPGARINRLSPTLQKPVRSEWKKGNIVVASFTSISHVEVSLFPGRSPCSRQGRDLVIWTDEDISILLWEIQECLWLTILCYVSPSDMMD